MVCPALISSSAISCQTLVETSANTGLYYSKACKLYFTVDCPTLQRQEDVMRRAKPRCEFKGGMADGLPGLLATFYPLAAASCDILQLCGYPS
ncbi:hypothetical protein J6590_106611 [Homalodisca vitripennis]|nr:hypothetical protein J6590_106611 [Homalodisca vitripennis]